MKREKEGETANDSIVGLLALPRWLVSYSADQSGVAQSSTIVQHRSTEFDAAAVVAVATAIAV